MKWLEDDSDEARREVALLKLLGLFDRPATADCVAALRKAPVIPGLTEPLVGVAEDDWEFSLTALRDAKLLTVNREEGSGVLLALDAHPLLREYFATQLRRQQPEAWRAAHRRVYETSARSWRVTRPRLRPPTALPGRGPWLPGGVAAGGFYEVYGRRIGRHPEFYSTYKLGAFGSDLGAVASFFQPPWSVVSPSLGATAKASLSAVASFNSRAVGRLHEALEPMRAGLELRIEMELWKNAAISAGNLSELELALGAVAGAVGDAEQSVLHADRSGRCAGGADASICMTQADALHQAGRRAEAEVGLPRRPRRCRPSDQRRTAAVLVQGFQYCDVLLAEAERAAWRASCRGGLRTPGDGDAHRVTLQAVSERAAQALKIAEDNNLSLHTIALDHLTLGGAALYAAILEGSSLDGLLHAPPVRRGRPPPRGHARLPPPRPPHPRLAAESGRQTHRLRERPERDLDGAGRLPCRPHETLHGRHPPPPRPPVLPRSAVSRGSPAPDSRRRARAHPEMRLRAAQGGAGGRRASDWRGRSLTPSWSLPSS